MTAPERIWATINGIQPSGGAAGLWRSDTPCGGEVYVRADLAAAPAQVRDHEQDLIIRDLTMMLIRAARYVPDDQMEGVFDYMRRKGIDHGPLRAAVEPQPVPLQAKGAKPLDLSDDLRGQLWQIVLKMTACDDEGCGQNNCSCMARYARILAAIDPAAIREAALREAADELRGLGYNTAVRTILALIGEKK